MGKVIKSQKVSNFIDNKWTKTEEMLATLCYYYPQYKYAEARKLPYRRVLLLLEQARKIESARMANLVQIAAAPHTKNFSGVKKLIKHFIGQAR